MKIATFNVNGVKARLPELLDWLREAAPDVAALQEIKSVDEGFPREAVEDLGYHVETHGQKGFNGVALLSKRPFEEVRRGLPGDESDAQARWIEGVVIAEGEGEGKAVRVCGLYLPNGNPAPGPKFEYKLGWMDRLAARAREILAAEEIAVLAGDYNVIPQPEDAKRPDAWREDALFRPESRAAWRRLVHLGLTDAWRALRADPGYTFWDYQAGAWGRDDGIRIDHALLTPQAADRLRDCGVDRAARAREKPSDHAPMWVELAL
ncbi:MAG: exodeoxyribonuclease III [Rubrimonas sp.]|uniref:exodeoxyribonuclease III n=1 Tax=Rubrimonas sp. TaxID=2036015 RepID=UPI002FDE0031